MAGWKQLLKQIYGIHKETNSALDKFKAAQKNLLNAAKGKPDADELRDALVGSPLKKEIASLKKLQGKLNKIISPRVRVMDQMPRITMKSALQRISKKPWPKGAYDEAMTIQGDCDFAAMILGDRYGATLAFPIKCIIPGVKAKMVQKNALTMTSVMRKCMRIPKVGSICGPIWLDFELSINPLVADINRSFGLIQKNYAKLNKKLLKEIVNYAEISKSVQKVMDDAEQEF